MTTPATPAADAVSPKAKMHPNNCRIACDAESCKCSPTRQAIPELSGENALFAEWLDAASLHVNAGGDIGGCVTEEDVRQLIRVCRARDNATAILAEIREAIGWEDVNPATTVKRLVARDRRCPTMEEAESRALLRGLMGCADEMGLSHESSPAAVVDALQCLKRRHALMMLSLEAQADERESALVAERDQLRAMVEDVSTEVHLLRAALVYIAEESDDMVALKCAQDALAAPAVEGV